MGIDLSWAAILEQRGLIDSPAVPGANVPAKPVRTAASHAPSRLQIVMWFPGLVTKSEANTGGKNRDKFARKSAQKAAVLEALPDSVPDLQLPARVRLIRVAAKRLDDDNLQSAFKAIRDAVATWLNVDDGDNSAVRWSYRQRAGYVSGVKIIIG